MDDADEREEMLGLMRFLDQIKSAAHKINRDKTLDVNRLLLDQVEQVTAEIETYE